MILRVLKFPNFDEETPKKMLEVKFMHLQLVKYSASFSRGQPFFLVQPQEVPINSISHLFQTAEVRRSRGVKGQSPVSNCRQVM